MIWEFFDAKRLRRDEDHDDSKRGLNRSEPKPKPKTPDRPTVRPTEIDEKAQAYLLHEYDAQSRYFSLLVQRVERELNFGFVATAVFWAWYLGQQMQSESTGTLLAWLPTVLTCAFLLKSLLYRRAIKALLKYRKDVEIKFRLPGRLGFVTQRKKYGREFPLWSPQSWWVLLLVLNVVAAVFRRELIGGSG